MEGLWEDSNSLQGRNMVSGFYYGRAKMYSEVPQNNNIALNSFFFFFFIIFASKHGLSYCGICVFLTTKLWTHSIYWIPVSSNMCSVFTTFALQEFRVGLGAHSVILCSVHAYVDLLQLRFQICIYQSYRLSQNKFWMSRVSVIYWSFSTRISDPRSNNITTRPWVFTGHSVRLSRFFKHWLSARFLQTNSNN